MSTIQCQKPKPQKPKRQKPKPSDVWKSDKGDVWTKAWTLVDGEVWTNRRGEVETIPNCPSTDMKLSTMVECGSMCQVFNSGTAKVVSLSKGGWLKAIYLTPSGLAGKEFSVRNSPKTIKRLDQPNYISLLPDELIGKIYYWKAQVETFDRACDRLLGSYGHYSGEENDTTDGCVTQDRPIYKCVAVWISAKADRAVNIDYAEIGMGDLYDYEEMGDLYDYDYEEMGTGTD